MPLNIKIIHYDACIRSYRKPGISLYYFNPFSFKGRISNNSCEIYSINSWFYKSNKYDQRLECYDISRYLVDSKDL